MTIQQYWELLLTIEGEEGTDWNYFRLCLERWEEPEYGHQN